MENIALLINIFLFSASLGRHLCLESEYFKRALCTIARGLTPGDQRHWSTYIRSDLFTFTVHTILFPNNCTCRSLSHDQIFFDEFCMSNAFAQKLTRQLSYIHGQRTFYRQDLVGAYLVLLSNYRIYSFERRTLFKFSVS